MLRSSKEVRVEIPLFALISFTQTKRIAERPPKWSLIEQLSNKIIKERSYL